MFPWLWLWAPHVEFPLSGNVNQDIDPLTQWFFGQIKPEAGHARIEQQAFQVASYGKQLGLLTEVVIGLAEKAAPQGGEAEQALSELKRIRDRIQEIKDMQYEAEVVELQGRVERVMAKGGSRSRKLGQRLKPLVADVGEA
jgi:hypothetical protein